MAVDVYQEVPSLSVHLQSSSGSSTFVQVRQHLEAPHLWRKPRAVTLIIGMGSTAAVAESFCTHPFQKATSKKFGGSLNACGLYISNENPISGEIDFATIGINLLRCHAKYKKRLSRCLDVFFDEHFKVGNILERLRDWTVATSSACPKCITLLN